MLKGGLNAASAYILGPQHANAMNVFGAVLPDVGVGSGCAPTRASTRERLLLDFEWRFDLGNAADPTLDFGYPQGRLSAKSGELFAPSREDFDDRGWRSVNLPHD
jgi:beta-galactosidase